MDQASDVTQWLVGQGGVRNFSALVATAPCTALAAAIDLNTSGLITVFPATSEDPDSPPETPDSAWRPGPEGTWQHAFDGFPNTDTADHMVLVGITSRREVLLLNLTALRGGTVGIESLNPVDVARSWILQILSRTPEAHVSTTVADTYIPGAARLTDTPTAETTVAFLGDTTATQLEQVPGRITVDCRRTAEPDDSLLCDAGAQTGVLTLGTWVFPIWRRVEITDEVWSSFRAAAAKTAPAEATPVAEPAATASQPSAAETTIMPVAEPDVDPPWRTDDEAPAAAEQQPSETASDEDAAGPPWRTDDEPAASPSIAPVAEPADVPLIAPTPVTIPTPSVPTTNLAPPITAPRRRPATPAAGPKISVLGPIVVEAADGTEHTPKFRGREKLLTRAILVVATGPAHGIPTAEWIENTWETTPDDMQKVRAMRTQIRKNGLAADDAIDFGTQVTAPSPQLLANSDWYRFLDYVGDDPASATLEDLDDAVSLLRGRPFEDAPESWNWKSLNLLKDQLVDIAADAALELAHRKRNLEDIEGCYAAARAGTRVNPDRSDLWMVALETAPADEQSEVLYDAEHVPEPSRDLRELIKFVRTEARAR